MKRITRTQAIEELTEEALQYYREHAKSGLRHFIRFGVIGFEDISNEDLEEKYMDLFGEEVGIVNVNKKQLDNIDRVTNTLVEVGALISKLIKLYEDIADEDYNSGTNVERFMPDLSLIFSHSLDDIDYHKVIADFSHFAQDIEDLE